MKASSSIITINGRSYDAITGFPAAHGANHTQPQPTHAVHKPAKQHPAPAHRPHRAFSDIAPQAHSVQMTVRPQATHQHPQQTAHSIHQPPQKTQTLYRAALKRPIPHPTTTRASAKRSPLITKFAPVPADLQPVTEEVQDGEAQAPSPPDLHPTVAKALKRHATNIESQPASSQALKEQLIKQRLAEVATAKAAPAKKSKQRFAMQPRLATIFTSAFALLLLGGYLTYINLPNLSMRVAAARAGVAAKFPTYQPDGYRFDGPISYTPGEVTINFKSTTNDSRFSIKQKASNWDSQAVLDNFVSKQSSTYLTYQERGLTIYAFNNKAAWVSGGLLYTIDGDASLSSEQVLRMATSI